MEIALMIMIAQGVLGAFDTVYYHEYVYRLPVHGPKVGGDLRLHAFRDFVYGLLFITLPFVKWQGLLAILLDPNPPPLICIDEPEVGLHPDAIALVGKAIQDAESRTQLIIATHSEALVNRFSDRPEAVIVCEKEANNATTLKRQSSQELSTWLEDYTLGDLWHRGVIGGNRR